MSEPEAEEDWGDPTKDPEDSVGAPALSVPGVPTILSTEAVERVVEDPTLTPREVIEGLFKVETKTPVDGQRIIPFRLNATQFFLDKAAETRKMHYILKARQLGCSTYIEARFLAKCLTVAGTHAAVVSHEKTSTMRLLRRVHFFINNLPKEVAVVKEYDNKYEITFPKKHSSFYLGTAGMRAFSRGDMLTDFHGSEIAFWPDAEGLMTGVTGALTDDAEVFLESTANGMGGYFYQLYLEIMRAQAAGEDHPYQFHFFPWYLAREYRRKLEGNEVWSPEEQEWRQRFRLDEAQLKWRRFKSKQYASEEKFLQEFPITPEEAFIVSGTCYFDKHSLRLYYQQAKEPIAKGDVVLVGDEPRFFRSTAGKLRLWCFPRPPTEYLMTVDCSEGIEGSNTDNTHLQVIAREEFSQVMSMSCKLDPHEIAVKAYAIGKWLGWPWLAVEDNGVGLACLLKLKELGYPRLYKHRRMDLEQQKETEKLGWHTDMRTRPLMLSALRSSMKQHTYLVRDSEFLQECTTFCRQDDGNYKANSGCHDDRVMGNAIAVYLNKLLPMSQLEDERDHVAPRELYRHSPKTGY